mmetsp:Transcript_26617/g.71458  ORF Transcript_26617/g.71458 Transcript_26617/m.71458 type:complete len:256 (-) Transcript_26617:127-894(-)
MVLVVDAWMVEHQAHHAYTNEGGLDPDTAWFAPAFNYLEVARQGGSRRVGLLASGLYPLLVPIMLLKSLGHLVKTRGWAVRGHDLPLGLPLLAGVALLSPLRFALDIYIFGPTGFAAALLTATMYLCVTFVATHAANESNYALTDDWALNQLRSTNNVASSSWWYSALCGGINCHIEHHLFPQISSTVLPEIAPVVKEYCRERGLPYNEKPSPFHLFREHAAFLRGFGPGIGRGAGSTVKPSGHPKAISRSEERS